MRCSFRPWLYNMLLLALGLLLLDNTSIPNGGLKKRYRIEEGSQLYLKGSSNVNTFTCDCEDKYTDQLLDIERSGGYARFKNMDLLLKIKNFNCHNRKIDDDMQKALKADQYPYIRISLIDSWQNARCLEGGCKGWFDVQAKVNVSITNVVKEQTIAARVRLLGPDKFQLQGNSALQMSAFGVKPPEAMFGMIKVNDWINFHFDLIIWVGNEQ